MYPQTQYASVHDADVAYQVIGEGPIDVVYCGGLLSHLELVWDYPEAEHYLARLASFCRLILIDRRGTGVSDPITGTNLPDPVTWADDWLAVLDAAGSECAALFAERDAGPLAIALAATHPDRVSALVLGNTTVRFRRADDYPFGAPPAVVDQMVEQVRRYWGTDEFTRHAIPSRADDARFATKAARFQRSAASPRTAAAQLRHFADIDVRTMLTDVRCPTLVLHRRDYAFLPAGHAEYLRDHLPGAELRMLEGRDAFFLYEGGDAVLRRIEAFLTGGQAQSAGDRLLETVLFIDIVASTETASELGDAEWRNLLANFHAIVARELDRFGARLIDESGDGLFAVCSGPTPAIGCARSIRAAVAELDLQIRAGIHVGECEVTESAVRGLTVHIGARIVAEAAAGEIWVSRTVRDLVVGGGFVFRHRGPKRLKGIPGVWRLFRVEDDEE